MPALQTDLGKETGDPTLIASAHYNKYFTAENSRVREKRRK